MKKIACAVMSAAFVLSMASANGAPTAPAEATAEFTQDEVADLTRPGRVYVDAEEAERSQRAFVQKWGGVDTGDVATAIIEEAQTDPANDAGISYDPETLTYTQWVVDGEAGDALGQKVLDRFNAVAGESNLKLEIGEAMYSEREMLTLEALINSPTRRPEELKGLKLGAGHDPAEGLVVVGTTKEDLETARAVLERAYPGQTKAIVFPSQPLSEHRRNDSPSNGWNGGNALCIFRPSSQGCNSVSQAPQDLAECTNGLKWIWGGVAYSTTAGHCVNAHGTNQEWFRYSDYRYTMGHAIHWSYGFDGDIALIRQTDWDYRNWFWVGGRYGGDEREITGSDKTPVTSQQVWISGANSGFTSATVADPETREFCDSGSPVTTTVNSTVQGGDSGAPVVTPNAASSQSGDYLAMGILACGGGGQSGFTRVQRIADRFGGFAANY